MSRWTVYLRILHFHIYTLIWFWMSHICPFQLNIIYLCVFLISRTIAVCFWVKGNCAYAVTSLLSEALPSKRPINSPLQEHCYGNWGEGAKRLSTTEAAMLGMAHIDEWKPVIAMLVFDLISAVTTALIKKALQEGLDRLVLITLRQLVATVFLAPIAYFKERYRNVTSQRMRMIKVQSLDCNVILNFLPFLSFQEHKA